MAVLEQKTLTSNSTAYEYLISNEQDMELLIEIYKTSNPSEKTLKKINDRIAKRPFTIKTIRMLMNYLVHSQILPPCLQFEKKIVTFL